MACPSLLLRDSSPLLSVKNQNKGAVAEHKNLQQPRFQYKVSPKAYSKHTPLSYMIQQGRTASCLYFHSFLLASLSEIRFPFCNCLVASFHLHAIYTSMLSPSVSKQGITFLQSSSSPFTRMYSISVL